MCVAERLERIAPRFTDAGIALAIATEYQSRWRPALCSNAMRWKSGIRGHSERPPGSVDPKLLEILVCPITKGPLEYDAEKQELISRKAKLAYPIRAGIPIMLPEEARQLE